MSKAIVNALTLTLVEKGLTDSVQVARSVAESFVQENEDLFALQPALPAIRAEVQRIVRPVEPDADEWLAQTSSAALAKLP